VACRRDGHDPVLELPDAAVPVHDQREPTEPPDTRRGSQLQRGKDRHIRRRQHHLRVRRQDQSPPH